MIEPELVNSLTQLGSLAGTGGGGAFGAFLLYRFLEKRKNGNGNGDQENQDRRKDSELKIENMLLKRDNQINEKISKVKEELTEEIKESEGKIYARMDKNKDILLTAITNIRRE